MRNWCQQKRVLHPVCRTILAISLMKMLQLLREGARRWRGMSLISKQRKEGGKLPSVQSLAFPISSVATDLLRNEVDLDLWLESRAAQLGGRVLSQSELLNNIASSVAAHFDTQVREEVDMLRSWKSKIAGVDDDFVAHYALAISSAVRDISKPILARRPA